MRHFSGHYSEAVEQQPENGVALALGVVIKDGAGAAALEAAARLMVEFVGGEFDRGAKYRRRVGGRLEPFLQRGFEVAKAFFHAAIVAGKVGRIVEGQHAEAGEEFVHDVMIERRNVVAFEEQGCAVLAEQGFEMSGDLAAVEVRIWLW